MPAPWLRPSAGFANSTRSVSAAPASRARHLRCRALPLDDREQGDTLIEVLIATLILALVGVATLSGLGTVAQSSGTQRAEASEEALLRSFAEVLVEPPDGNGDTKLGYVSCATTSSYSVPSWFSVPSGYDAPTISSVGIWDGSSTTLTNGGSYDPPVFTPASPGPCTDHGLQQITVTESTTAGSPSASITILKARVP